MRGRNDLASTRAVRALLLDVSGAVADLGVLIPIASALVLKNGFDAATILIGVGALYIAAGTYFRVPFPVQPIKAASAIVIAQGLPPLYLAAAALIIGAFLLLIAITRSMRFVEAIFRLPIVRGVQLGVGLILINAALGFGDNTSGGAFFVIAVTVAAVLTATALRRAHLPLALLVVVGGMSYSVVTGSDVSLATGMWQPQIAVVDFSPNLLLGTLFVLVIPQLPLTLGNAVVALTDVEHRYFGQRAARVTPQSVCVSSGIGNVVAGMFMGMAMCHGSGGLTAHYRAGARTFRMNLVIGAALLVLGLFFGPTAFALLALIPAAVLAGLLAFTGVMHGLLVRDQRGYELLVALAMGLVAVATTNLALSLAAGLVLFWPLKLLRASAFATKRV